MIKFPVKDRVTAPYMTEREIPAVKAALSAWRKLRRDKEERQRIRGWAGMPLTTTEEAVSTIAWNLELLSQIEERIRKENEKHA